MLQEIPHVILHFDRPADLCIIAGSWQSLGVHNARLDFADMDAFVTGTEKFYFHYSSGQHVLEFIEDPCRKHGLKCYSCTRNAELHGPDCSKEAVIISVSNTRCIAPGTKDDCDIQSMSLID